MGDKALFETHALNLGKLVGNLQSLEMGARMAVVKLDEDAARGVQTQLSQVKAGDLVEPNAFTANDDLNQVLKRFNKRAPSGCRIDVAPVVRLRDALAHGRTYGFGPVKPLRLLKFSRKADASGRYRVELSEDMTDEWFRSNLCLLSEALDRVRAALDYEKREFI